MSPQQDPADLKHELQATLAARREMGPAYDEQFLDKLVERLTRQMQPAQPAPLPANAPVASQRTAVAICSLIFGIPLVAITLSAGFWAFLLIVLMILGINFAFAFNGRR